MIKLEKITRIEILFNDDREAVETLDEATWKYVTIFDDEGEIEEQYSVPIIDGVDLEDQKKSLEGFNEEEHPRDNDGQFIDKGGSSSSQSKKTRDRVIDRETENHEKRIKKLREITIPKYQAMIDDPNYESTHDLDSKEYLELRVRRMEENIIKYTALKENSMKIAKEMKEKYDSLNLLEMSGIGKNTHKVGSRGFKNAITKSIMKDWKLEMRRGTYLTKREYESYEGGHEDKLIRVEEWEDRFKGKTLIDSNIPHDDSVKSDMQDEVMFFWNEVMTDEQRSGVDVLKIYWSDNPLVTKRKSGSLGRTLGSHSSRSGYKYKEEKPILLSPSILTMNISSDDSANDVLNTMIHETAHNQWSNNVRNNWTKVNKFTEKILAIGREGAITEYAGSYFDDLEIVTKENEGKWEKEKDRLINNHHYGRNDVQTDQEYADWLNQNILNDVVNAKKRVQHEERENVAKVERLISNETHSEYFAMVSAPTEKSYHTVDTVKLEKMSKLIKEGFYD